MIYPNKHITFEESIIFKMISILENSSEYEVDIHELFKRTKKKFKNADEFIYSLDVLYVLDMIEVDFSKETVKYVKRN
uniref:ABC-three component system middle component 7 n=1 Tax=uncultured Tenacibaculum sp. TaxID=174713 RepID=UPI0026069920|nr:ABC-three component system middle component 7 [uncultured Tenacibaculum sp.]